MAIYATWRVIHADMNVNILVHGLKNTKLENIINAKSIIQSVPTLVSYQRYKWKLSSLWHHITVVLNYKMLVLNLKFQSDSQKWNMNKNLQTKKIPNFNIEYQW